MPNPKINTVKRFCQFNRLISAKSVNAKNKEMPKPNVVMNEVNLGPQSPPGPQKIAKMAPTIDNNITIGNRLMATQESLNKSENENLAFMFTN